MILWKFTLREVKSRPGRAMLTLLSIVIGVAAVVAVAVGTNTTNQACQDMYASMAGRAALEVVGDGDAFFDEDVTAAIEKTPGVKIAVPSIQRYASLRFQNNKGPVTAIGIDPERDKAVRDYALEEGGFFENGREALLSTGFARGLGIRVGDQVKLGTNRGGLGLKSTSFKIVGLLSSRGAAGFRQGALGTIFLPLGTAERLFSTAGNVNTISIVLNDGADEKTAAEAIRAILPTGLSVRSPGERSQLSKETIEKVRQGLKFAYVMIFSLAFFMILNTFLMNVGERRRQLAVLRAIGATRRQLVRMLLLEGITMGIVGTVLGIGAGLGGAILLTQSMSQVYETAMPSLRITPAPFILAAILGPSVSLFAMFVPAWIAGRVSPLEGMRFVASEGRHRVSVAYVLISLLVFLVTGSLLAACIVGHLPPQLLVVVGMLFTVAFLLLLPIVLGLLAWLVALALRPLLGAEGRIAHRQILRRRVRTTLTVGILYLAVSTAISLGTNILDNVQDIHAWLETTLKADFFVRLMNQNVATGESAKMPESFANDLRAINGVANVDSLRQIPASVRAPGVEDGKLGVNVFVRDCTDKGNLPLDIKSGDPALLRQRLAQGEVALGDVLAHRLGVKVGDEITLDTREGPRQLRVAATVTMYITGGSVVYMEGKTARRLLNTDGVDAYAINTTPGSLGDVEAKLKSFCETNGLMLQSSADLRKRIDNLTKGVVAGLWGLLVLGLIVGAFAIGNTLTMNVLEQTRELALLRVVAMTRWQVRKTILAQAVIIGVIGLATGTVGGIIGAYVMNLSSLPLLGHAPAFALHASLLAMCFGVGLAVIIAAAWLPAERAARLNLLIALQYE
jgi:putative ABC transport system permease protein